MTSWVDAGFEVAGQEVLWLIWIAVDLVGVPLAFSSGLVVSGAVYGIFFVMVVIGFRGWLRQYRNLKQIDTDAVNRAEIREAVAV